MEWVERKALYGKDFVDYHYDHAMDSDFPLADNTEFERFLLNIVPGAKRVMDCGCAVGAMLYKLLAVDPALELWGFDLSEYAIQHCVPSMRERLSVLDLAVETIPYSDGYFDLAIAMDFFEHQDGEHVDHVISEVCRVTGGCVFIRQPLVQYDGSYDERHNFFGSWNHLTHKERLAVVDNHEQIRHSTPEYADIGYHPCEYGRDYFIIKFLANGFKEMVLPEHCYHFPNPGALCSFNTLVFARARGV